jgi:hypothetical protein
LPSDEEIVLPLPVARERVVPATQFRSTWIVASQRGLRACGHFDRYASQVDPSQRSALLHCVAGVWLPMSLARAHYDACDALNLSAEEQLKMGDLVGDHGAATLIATVAKVAKGAGATPWAVFPQLDRIWRRGANGGAVSVTRCGPKEAIGEVVGCELFDVPYFRVAFRGVVLGMTRPFCTNLYLREVATRSPGALGLRFQWV